MVKKYSPLVIVYIILFGLSSLGFFLFRKWGVPEIINAICGGGLIVISGITFVWSLKINKKNQQLEEIKNQQNSLEEELRAKVDYEKTYLPKMNDLDKRIASKADDAKVDGLIKLIEESDKNNHNRFEDMKTFILKNK